MARFSSDDSATRYVKTNFLCCSFCGDRFLMFSLKIVLMLHLFNKKGKGKGFPILDAERLGPELIPVYRQSARR